MNTETAAVIILGPAKVSEQIHGATNYGKLRIRKADIGQKPWFQSGEG